MESLGLGWQHCRMESLSLKHAPEEGKQLMHLPLVLAHLSLQRQAGQDVAQGQHAARPGSCILSRAASAHEATAEPALLRPSRAQQRPSRAWYWSSGAYLRWDSRGPSQAGCCWSSSAAAAPRRAASLGVKSGCAASLHSVVSVRRAVPSSVLESPAGCFTSWGSAAAMAYQKGRAPSAGAAGLAAGSMLHSAVPALTQAGQAAPQPGMPKAASFQRFHTAVC